MTRIDFYILNSPSPDARLQYACRLAHKAWQQSRHVYLHCADEAEASRLDDLLWSFRADSFLPHALHADQPNEAVVCGDRKSTRLNSSHVRISYAVFCL